jgi:DNA-binding response OmpR family regulator
MVLSNLLYLEEDSMDKVLYVEDSPEAILVLKSTLRDFDLTVCSTLQEARNYIATNDYRVVIIDIELPDGRGHELMPAILSRSQQTSVLFLTSHDEFHEKLVAFSLGAVDYIQKPFDPRELKLRVEAQIRQMNMLNSVPSVINYGNLSFNVEEQKVYNKSGEHKELDLTGSEFKIFHLLAKNNQKIISREEIFDKIWGHSISVTPRTVDVHISNLRRKIMGSDVSILHKHGLGYYISNAVLQPTL